MNLKNLNYIFNWELVSKLSGTFYVGSHRSIIMLILRKYVELKFNLIGFLKAAHNTTLRRFKKNVFPGVGLIVRTTAFYVVLPCCVGAI
jgi:hypothetical protein